MYFSAGYIDIKLNQDYSDFKIIDNDKVLIICDGIGEFEDSGEVSEFVVKKFIELKFPPISKLIYDKDLLLKKNSGIKGGTTFISAINKDKSNDINIEYLGNGGVIHFYGDFAVNQNTKLPYRYVELMLPHINPKGALTKHISHNSGKEEFKSSKLKINLSNLLGDILLFYSDGITSLEDNFILEDSEGRFWRKESTAVQFILKELDDFLMFNNGEDFQDKLIEFNKLVLEKLKSGNYLEDDASLGIIITQEVLRYYQSKQND